MGGDIHQSNPGGIIRARVIPRAKTNEIAEILQDGRVKIRLISPPVDGKANKALVIFLAALFNVPRTSVQIISGITARDKVIRINGLDQESIDMRILKELA